MICGRPYSCRASQALTVWPPELDPPLVSKHHASFLMTGDLDFDLSCKNWQPTHSCPGERVFSTFVVFKWSKRRFFQSFRCSIFGTFRSKARHYYTVLLYSIILSLIGFPLTSKQLTLNDL